jgi:fused signal recognition particle receptor
MAEEKKGFFKRLKEGLSKTRNSIVDSFSSVFGASHIDDDFYEELEETFIMADMGYETTEKVIENLKERVKEARIKEPAACKELIINIIRDQMMVDESAYDFEKKKSVILVIGVNGVGKTTTIGKLAAQYKKSGKKVLIAAADTFRAAAIDQLKTWADRAGVEMISHNEGADPAAVVYDAVSAAKARNTDILLIDTAGRLHNKKNLMDELAKMRRIISRDYPDANVESLIVLDGTTGQNALEQARQFSNVTEIDGIVITKLDGTAKGGIAIAIQAELNVPVKFIGIGEKTYSVLIRPHMWKHCSQALTKTEASLTFLWMELIYNYENSAVYYSSCLEIKKI